MNKTDLRWGVSSPIYFEDWSHSTIDTVTGVEKPLTIRLNSRGVYSFEVTNEELFTKTNIEKEYDEDSEYMWINNILAKFYSIYITEKGENKVQLFDLIGNIYKSEELLNYVNEQVANNYGELGFVFTSIIVEDLSIDEESKKKIEQFEESQLKNKSENNNEPKTQSTTSQSTEEQVSQTKSNSFLGIGIILAIIVTISIVSVILLHNLKK